MGQTYILLRNNQEQGPYSFEDLLHCSLRPTDLLWKEGQIGWHFPSEVEELNALFPNNTIAQNPVSVTQRKELLFAAAGKKNAESPVSFGATQDETEQEENELTEEKLSKRADDLYRRIVMQSLPVPEKRYAHTLREMQKNYTDWLQKKERKHKAKLVQKKAAKIAGGIAIIACCAFYLQPWMHKAKKDALPSYAAMAPATISAKHDVKTNIANKENVVSVATSTPVENKVTTTSSVDAFIDSIDKVLARTTVRLTAANHVAIVQQRKTKNKKGSLQPVVFNQVPTTDLQPAKITVPITQLIDLHLTYQYGSDQTINSIVIALKNNSTEMVQQATVEAKYFRKKEKLVQTEALHFAGIKPGETQMITLPFKRKIQIATVRLTKATTESE